MLQYWNLTRQPFENTRAGDWYYQGRQHREALARLRYIVRDGNMGFGLLTGEIGCGKTITINVLQSELAAGSDVPILLENACPDFDEVLRDILAKLLPPRPGALRRRAPIWLEENRYALLRRFRTEFEERILRRRRHLVVILDEAQQLSPEALVELKNLTNIDSDRGGLTVILAGQPELTELVQSLPQVDQRVGLRYHLHPLGADEVGEYVRRRLQAAGAERDDLFAAEAIEALYTETAGVPREINRIGKLALDRAYAVRARQVERETVEMIVADLFRQSPAA